MTADDYVMTAMESYWRENGIYPNALIMGRGLLSELKRNVFSFNNLEDSRCVSCEFCGIPIDVDYFNPDALKVGHMVDYTNDRYKR